jgi:hypothetical protein
MDESEVLRFEQQKQITKLSQAIREGAKLRPQCTKYFFGGGGSCAFGAAYEAITGYKLPEYSTNGVEVLKRVPNYGGDLSCEIVRWNDSGMTREAIADKLEALGY